MLLKDLDTDHYLYESDFEGVVDERTVDHVRLIKDALGEVPPIHGVELDAELIMDEFIEKHLDPPEQSCKIIEKWLPDMFSAMLLSRTTQREVGFSICEKAESVRGLGMGDRESIALGEMLPFFEKVCFSFHTHLGTGGGMAFPSIGDVSNWLNITRPYVKYLCIGATEAMKVRCFDLSNLFGSPPKRPAFRTLTKEDERMLEHLKKEYEKDDWSESTYLDEVLVRSCWW